MFVITILLFKEAQSKIEDGIGNERIEGLEGL